MGAVACASDTHSRGGLLAQHPNGRAALRITTYRSETTVRINLDPE